MLVINILQQLQWYVSTLSLNCFVHCITGYFGGTIDYVNEPFCGRASGMNVARIYDRGSLDVNNGGFVSQLTICFNIGAIPRTGYSS